MKQTICLQIKLEVLLPLLNVTVQPELLLVEHALKEYAQAEGVLVKLGVATELTSDLSWEKGVSEMAEYCKKALYNSTRP